MPPKGPRATKKGNKKSSEGGAGKSTSFAEDPQIEQIEAESFEDLSGDLPGNSEKSTFTYEEDASEVTPIALGPGDTSMQLDTLRIDQIQLLLDSLNLGNYKDSFATNQVLRLLP